MLVARLQDIRPLVSRDGTVVVPRTVTILASPVLLLYSPLQGDSHPGRAVDSSGPTLGALSESDRPDANAVVRCLAFSGGVVPIGYRFGLPVCSELLSPAVSRLGPEIVERRARFSIKIQDNCKLISDYPSDLPDFWLSEVVRWPAFKCARCHPSASE